MRMNVEFPYSSASYFVGKIFPAPAYYCFFGYFPIPNISIKR